MRKKSLVNVLALFVHFIAFSKKINKLIIVIFFQWIYIVSILQKPIEIELKLQIRVKEHA